MNEIPAWAMQKAENVIGFRGAENQQNAIAKALIAERNAMQVEYEILKTEISKKAREWAAHYPEASDGRNTFVLFAEWIEAKQCAAQ